MRRGSAPRLDEVRHAVDQRGRLAGAGTGDDEQRPVAVLRGGELLGVELVEHGGVLLGRSACRVAPAGDGSERTFAREGDGPRATIRATVFTHRRSR